MEALPDIMIILLAIMSLVILIVCIIISLKIIGGEIIESIVKPRKAEIKRIEDRMYWDCQRKMADENSKQRRREQYINLYITDYLPEIEDDYIFIERMKTHGFQHIHEHIIDETPLIEKAFLEHKLKKVKNMRHNELVTYIQDNFLRGAEKESEAYKFFDELLKLDVDEMRNSLLEFLATYNYQIKEDIKEICFGEACKILSEEEIRKKWDNPLRKHLERYQNN